MSIARRDAVFPTMAADAVALLMRILGWMMAVWGPPVILAEFALAPPELIAVPDAGAEFVVFWLVGAAQAVLVGLLLLWLSAGILRRYRRRTILAAVLVILVGLGSLAAALIGDWALASRVAAACWGVTMVAFGAALAWEAALHRRGGGDDAHR